jgi:hypothetical protein
VPGKLKLHTFKLTKGFKLLKHYKTGREEEIGGVRKILAGMQVFMQYPLVLVKVGLAE